ncbi:hypothetical protein L208DRAFT_618072 [Tricholoma matsutake]|nr:hypothetical protein L208DRAFT_618072 [Tricholoma matsutake 945]
MLKHWSTPFLFTITCYVRPRVQPCIADGSTLSWKNLKLYMNAELTLHWTTRHRTCLAAVCSLPPLCISVFV